MGITPPMPSGRGAQNHQNKNPHAQVGNFLTARVWKNSRGHLLFGITVQINPHPHPIRTEHFANLVPPPRDTPPRWGQFPNTRYFDSVMNSDIYPIFQIPPHTSMYPIFPRLDPPWGNPSGGRYVPPPGVPPRWVGQYQQSFNFFLFFF